MKKALLFTWYLLSFGLLLCGIFLHNDELLTRRELIYVIILLTAVAALSLLSLRAANGAARKTAFFVSAILSFAFGIWTENHQPLYVFLPDAPQITVNTGESPISLEWAYWAETPKNLKTNIYEWKSRQDINLDRMIFSEGWQRSENAMVCTENCTITFPSGLHLHQPILSFRSESHSVVNAGEHPYDVQPGVATPVFVSSHKISRQLIFAAATFILCGVLTCILSFPAALLRRKEKGDQDVHAWVLYPAAFLLPVFILLCICWLLKITPFGENTLLISDMECQYVDFLVHIRTLLREGRSLFYSFSKSLGDDYLSLLAYYLSNPLDWLIAFFPDDRIPEAVSLLVILRYALCGLTAAIYFRKAFKTRADTLIFSTAYALMSLNFVIAEHTQLRNGAFILPLVFLGIERLIDRKGGLVYYLSLASAILLNYYSGFQICYFAVPYFLCRLYLSEKPGKKWTVLRFGLWSILSAGTCAVLLIPVVLQLGGGMKTFDLSIFTLEPNFRITELAGKLFNSAFDQSQTLTSGLPNVFCGVMVPLCIPMFFLNRKISRKEKISMLLLLISGFLTMWINALNLTAHGFNEPVWWPYRYSFAVSFLLLLPALRCLQNRDGNTSLHLGASTLLMFIMLFFLHKQSFTWLDGSAVILNVILIVMLAGILCVNSGRTKSTLVLLICADLFLNGWMILADKTAYERSETRSSFNDFYAENRALIAEIKTRDKDLYRIEKTYFHDANDAFLLDYSGISHFSSTLKYKIMQFLPAAGYRFYPTRFEYAEGSTVTMDSLLGIRYLATDADRIGKPYTTVFSRGDKTVYRNPYSLPIGFMVNGEAELIEDILLAADSFAMQNMIFEALSGNPEPIFHPALIEEQMPGENEISWQLKCESTGTLYAFFESDEEILTAIEVNGKYIADYFDGRGHPVLRLGSFAAGDVILITMKTYDPGSTLQLTKALFVFENPFLLLEETGKLKGGALNISEHSDARIRGQINAATDGKLFLSIPFDKGWTMTVDGVKTELQPAFGFFTFADIPAGDHQIRLAYVPRGITAGAAASIFSVLCAAVFLLTERKKLSQTAVKKP